MKRTNITKQEFLELTNKSIDAFKERGEITGVEDRSIRRNVEMPMFDIILNQLGKWYGDNGIFSINYIANEDETFDVYGFSYAFYADDEWYVSEDDIDNDFKEEE